MRAIDAARVAPFLSWAALCCRLAMSLCPWSSSREWDDVFHMLYSSDADRQRKGLARVTFVRLVVSVIAIVSLLPRGKMLFLASVGGGVESAGQCSRSV